MNVSRSSDHKLSLFQFVAGMNDLDKLFLAVDFYGVENFKHAVQVSKH